MPSFFLFEIKLQDEAMVAVEKGFKFLFTFLGEMQCSIHLSSLDCVLFLSVSGWPEEASASGGGLRHC